MSSAKWRPFCLGLNVLIGNTYKYEPLPVLTRDDSVRFVAGKCKHITLDVFTNSGLSGPISGNQSEPGWR